MASKVDWSTLEGYKAIELTPNQGTQETPTYHSEFTVTIEASCPTGFEVALLNEIKEKSPSSITVKHQGRVFFDIPVSKIRNVLELKCVDNAYVIIGKRSNFDFTGDVESCLKRINELLDDKKSDSDNLPLAWNKGIIAWNEIFQFKDTGKHNWGKCLSLLKLQLLQELDNSNEVKKPKYQDSKENMTSDTNAIPKPTFRVTCYRSGQNCHPFQSMDVARSFGGAINDKYGWGVSMKEFDIEVVITIDLAQIYVGIGLTKKKPVQKKHQTFWSYNIESNNMCINASVSKYSTG